MMYFWLSVAVISSVYSIVRLEAAQSAESSAEEEELLQANGRASSRMAGYSQFHNPTPP
jgi:hypothetical protein